METYCQAAELRELTYTRLWHYEGVSNYLPHHLSLAENSVVQCRRQDSLRQPPPPPFFFPQISTGDSIPIHLSLYAKTLTINSSLIYLWIMAGELRFHTIRAYWAYGGQYHTGQIIYQTCFYRLCFDVYLRLLQLSANHCGFECLVEIGKFS